MRTTMTTGTNSRSGRVAEPTAGGAVDAPWHEFETARTNGSLGEGRLGGPRRTALRMALLYTAFATVWIGVTDFALEALVTDPVQLARFQLLKGLIFVVATAVFFYLLTLADQLARARAESDARRTAEVLRTFIRSVPLAVIGLDTDDRVQLWNPTAERLFGWSEDEVIGEPLPYIPPDKYGEAELLRGRTSRGEALHGLEVTRRRKDGSSVDVSIWTAPLRNSGGAVTGTVVAISDMTEWRRAQQNIRQQVDRLTSLRLIDQAIAGSLDLGVMLNVLLDQLVSRLHVDAAAVLLLDPDTQLLRLAAKKGLTDEAWNEYAVRVGEGLAGRVAKERRTVFISDMAPERLSAPDRARTAAAGFRSYFAAPLIAKGQVRGILEVYRLSPFEPAPDWIEFFEALARQAAIAVDNARLFEELQRSNADLVLAYDTTLEGWSRALDLRDRETEGHTRRVTEMTLRLARAVGIGERELVHVRRGALLHDIGKMAVPDRILHKPGPLNDEEWAIMRMHPVYAYELLAPIEFLRPAIDIPYCHHERWDGSGYPRGLRGEHIPLTARIFAVVDVWDALRSDRPYREAWPEARIREYLRANVGTLFDPAITEIFLRMDWQQPSAV